jgi:hypothetical protein
LCGESPWKAWWRESGIGRTVSLLRLPDWVYDLSGLFLDR